MAHAHDQDPHRQDPRLQDPGAQPGAGWPDQPAAERAGSSTSWYADSTATGGDAAQAPSYSEAAARAADAGPYGAGAPAYGAAIADGTGPQAYAQPAYGQQPAPTGGGYGQVPSGQSGTGLSIASMVIGILSLLGGLTLVIPPIVGVVLGHMGLKREPRGRGFAIAGLVTNYLGIAFLVLGILAIVLLMVFAGAAATSAGY